MFSGLRRGASPPFSVPLGLWTRVSGSVIDASPLDCVLRALVLMANIGYFRGYSALFVVPLPDPH